MKRAETFGLVVVLVAASPAAGCGSKARERAHPNLSAAATPAPPTPDTTPIEALRTPAGLVLRPDAPTPTPTP